MADIKEVQKTEVQTGVTKIGFGQLNNPTPSWVTWVFRTEFVLNKAIMFWLSSTTLVPAANMKEIILALGTIDLLVWGVGRFVGVSKEGMGQ